MIAERTVLVLGAGASVPYGFPSGQGLVRVLADKPGEYAESLMLHGYRKGHIASFVEELSKSNTPSIDTFLGHREDYREIGKAAIAAVIMAGESAKACLKAVPSLLIQKDDDWLGYLWHQMLAGVSTFEEFTANQLAVITFNYDRSFEFYLSERAKAMFNLRPEDADLGLRKIPIIHVHGQVGQLPGYTSLNPGSLGVREYEPENRGEKLSAATSGIRVLHEADDNSVEFEIARKLLREASRVFFVGNAYHADNIRRLNLESCSGIPFLGSALGLTDSERTQAMKRFPKNNRPTFSAENMDARDFLRAHAALLSR